MGNFIYYEDLQDYYKQKEKAEKYDELEKWLQSEIKRIDKIISTGNPKPYGAELNLYENTKLRYYDILKKMKAV